MGKRDFLMPATRRQLRKPKLRPAAKEFLKYLAIAGTVVAVSLIAPQLPAALLTRFLSSRRRFDRTKLRQFGRRLSRRGMVALHEADSVLTFKLTPEGERCVKILELEELRILKPERWDGAWRVVLFDVPEHRRDARDALRGTLQRLGFIQIQRSVFVHPFPCAREVEHVVRVYHLERSVILFSAATMSDDVGLRRRFGVALP